MLELRGRRRLQPFFQEEPLDGGRASDQAWRRHRREVTDLGRGHELRSFTGVLSEGADQVSGANEQQQSFVVMAMRGRLRRAPFGVKDQVGGRGRHRTRDSPHLHGASCGEVRLGRHVVNEKRTSFAEDAVEHRTRHGQIADASLRGGAENVTAVGAQ